MTLTALIDGGIFIHAFVQLSLQCQILRKFYYNFYWAFMLENKLTQKPLSFGEKSDEVTQKLWIYVYW